MAYYVSDMTAATKKTKKQATVEPVVIVPDSKKADKATDATLKKSEKSADTPTSSGKKPVKIKDFRWLKIAGICLGIVIGFAVLSAIIFNGTNNSKLTDYKSSKEFKAFSASLGQYLNTNNGIYTKAFNCSASLDQLWNPPLSPISKKKESLEVQLARQLIDLKPKWEAASSKFPSYSSFFLFKVLPFDHGAYKNFQNTADLIDRSGALVNHTEDFNYYCPASIYPGISIFGYLDEYSKDKPVTENVATINQRIKAVADAGNDFAKTKQYKTWVNVRKNYLDFLHKVLADLTSLRDQTAKTPGKVNMHTQFAADKKALEKVISQATEAGKTINPNQDDLKELYTKAVTIK